MWRNWHNLFNWDLEIPNVIAFCFTFCFIFIIYVDAGEPDGGQREGGAVTPISSSGLVSGGCWTGWCRWSAKVCYWQLFKHPGASQTEETAIACLQRSTSVQQRSGGWNCESYCLTSCMNLRSECVFWLYPVFLNAYILFLLFFSQLWVKERMPLATSTDHGKDLPTVQLLIKKNQVQQWQRVNDDDL